MSDEITPNTQTPQTEPQIEPISESVEVTIPSEPEIPTVEPEPTLNSTVESGATAQIPVSEPLDTPEVKTAEPSAESVNIQADKEPETPPEEKPLAPSEPVQEESKSSNPETSESKTDEPEPIETKAEEKEIPETKSEPKQETKPDPEPEQPKVIPVIISKKNIARELLVKARNAIQSRKRKKLDRVLSLFAKQTKITNDEVEKFLHVSDATATRYLSQLEKENIIKQTGKTGKSVFYSKI